MNDIAPIYIRYGGKGFSGELWIAPLFFFPIPVTHMKRLMKMCQFAIRPEEQYLREIMEALETLRIQSGSFSHKRANMILNDIKVVQERLDKIGGRR